jgi:SAM (Sterile alpha motif) domain-containing protein
MYVGVWLRRLGLAQYEAAFGDNDIDESLLPKLTVDDLKDLGVASVGHRRKIMSAIDRLNVPSVLPTDAANRRQLTVVFCDLVDRRRSHRGSIPRTCVR